MLEIGDYAEVGKFVRSERKAQGIKQKDFADTTGYSVTHIIHIEQGYDTPSFTMTENILTALGYRLVIGVEKIDGTV